jgi:hypothetical protein
MGVARCLLLVVRQDSIAEFGVRQRRFISCRFPIAEASSFRPRGIPLPLNARVEARRFHCKKAAADEATLPHSILRGSST